ncbi:MAG: hypothetical protein H6Q90_5934 [Deltaproteobacteria bacterium]|nr:hypothetical protein [Deltaproteobacteria bacterium]
MGRRLTILIAVVLGACAADLPDEHDEPADFEEVPAGDGKADTVSATFNPNTVLTDALFIDSTAMDVSDMQEFLENTPYGTTSWLATHTVNGVSAAQMIVDAARAESINPLLLLTRMQVEATLVSKTTTPSQTRINTALGCACPDTGGCASQYRGLAAQLTCGARTLRRWYDGSVDASGEWRRGVAKKTLDPKLVTPTNHATASLYAYTPWVLTNRGGNWLVWNVTRKYVRHAEDTGLIPTP